MQFFARALLTGVLILAVLAAGCGEGDDQPPAVSTPTTPSNPASPSPNNPGPTPPRVNPGSIDVSKADRCDFLDQSECLYPFPNNDFTTPDAQTATGLRVNFNRQSMPANKEGTHINPAPWNHSDGFSPGEEIITKVPGLGTPQALKNTGAPTIDHIGRSLKPNSPVVVIDTNTGQRWPVWAEVDQAPNGKTVDGSFVLKGSPPAPKNAALIIHPAKNLTEGHRYIVALRNLKNDNGKTIQASPAFRLYRDGISTDVSAIEARRSHMADIFKRLQDAGVDRDNLYLAWDFTVASRGNITGRELYIRNQAFDQLGDTNLSDGDVSGQSPTFKVNKVTAFTPCDPSGCQDGQSDRLLRRVEGTVTVPCYLDQMGCPAGSKFAYTDASADHPKRISGNVYKASFICNIPRSVKADDGSVRPSRVSLYGHGLFGSPSEVNAGNVQDMASEHNFTFCATAWIGMASGDVANTINILKNLSQFPELVDRTQQSMVDFMYLGRAMIHPQGFAADTAFKVKNGKGNLVSAIDPSHLYYDGNSQGGIFGGTLIALEPDLTRGVLGVPAINYSILLRRSVDFAAFAAVLYPSYTERLARPLVLGLIQMLWDRSDPDGYAENMTDNPLPGTPAHKVLMQPAYGDHQVTNWAVEVEARTLGARRHTPTVDPGRLNTPDGDPFYGIPPIESHPFTGSAAIVFWDSGPVRDEGNKGTAPPPLENIPDQKGQDPHELPRNDADARRQKSEFLKPEGKVVNVCGDHPCYDDDYTGP